MVLMNYCRLFQSRIKIDNLHCVILYVHNKAKISKIIFNFKRPFSDNTHYMKEHCCDDAAAVSEDAKLHRVTTVSAN